MHAEQLLPRQMHLISDRILGPKRIHYKSERIKLDAKSKELLTKYRKGLIWQKGI